MKVPTLSRFYRGLACLLLVSILTQIIYPTAVYALTGGPSQPEFSGFESVSTSEMVNAFTGDFTYNLPVLTVPGPQGSSYPLSLSYHSGTSSEEEASWVGYGWSLSPGAINRNMRGLPDDDKGNEITYYNKMPRNWTVMAGAGVSVEAFSMEKIGKVGLNADASLKYNSYSGFGYSYSLNLSKKLNNANVGIGFSRSETGRSFSLTASPYKNVASVSLSLHDTPDGMTLSGNINPFTSLYKLADDKKENTQKALKSWAGNSRVSFGGGNHGIFSFSEMQRPTVVTAYTGTATDVDVALEVDALVPIGVEPRIRGSYSYQENIEKTPVQSYGYLYTSQAKTGSSIQDYYTEKDTPYNKRDVFLGIGMNNADNFSVSGEGLNGGFRLYHKQIGQFYPNTVKSRTERFSAGIDLHIGPTIGVGITDVGSGDTEMEQRAWDNTISTFSTPTADDESVFFRFNNDMGGTLSYNNLNDPTLKYADEPVAALVRSSGDWGFKTGSVRLPKSPALPAALTERNRRSSYIGYTLNKDMLLSDGSPSLRAYSKRADITQLAHRTEKSDQIGEFSVYNSSGMQYIYALPVYTRKEKQLQVGTKGASIDYNYLAYGINEDDQKVKVGSVRNHTDKKAYSSAYANTFLLTQINTPDYVDVDHNGPSLRDRGGYTSFQYTKLYGKPANAASDQEGNWYRWRLPYTGHIYQRGSFSDPQDDRASVSQGEKEIYLLSKIETKTHIAVFTTADREDAIDAAEDANQHGQKGTNRLQLLKRIDLYNKADYDVDPANAKPIKTVFFDYDYSLCPGIPNGTNGQGKLTLKKVWFEYYGVKQAAGKISPYVFEYKYPDYSTYPTRYTSLGTGYNQYQVDGQGNDPQNPRFSYFQNDAWSNYQEAVDGQNRFNALRTWLNQTPDMTKFDPAAWQLKVIKLPSGGEIHVQYEQDDYAYVQDQPAHVMRQLEWYDDKGHREVVLASEAGESPADLDELSKAIRAYYINGGRKMYFKFLYRLLDNVIGRKPEPSVSDDCNADYMTGYVNVQNVFVAGGKVHLILGGGDKYELPKQVCLDFVKTQRVGKLSGTCQGGGLTGTNAESLVRGLVNMARISISDYNICAGVSASNSYLRIPALKAKKGGGLRVKRLLTFDKGMNGESVLYGSEYLYETTDATGKRITSGVATMEPSSIREENVLVSFIKRGDQSGFSKIISGIDKKQSEGPLGESVMPGASVGYSKVITRNIHSGKTSTGFSINEYYTPNQPLDALPSSVRAPRGVGGATSPASSPVTRNPNGTYAFFGRSTDIQQADPDYQMLPLVLVNRFVNRSWLSQGFSFYINDMTGKPKRMATYAGTYTQPGDENKATLITEQAMEYYQPGEKIPVVDPKTGALSYQPLGQEIDVSYAQRAISEKSDDIGVTMDFTTCLICLGVSFPVVLPSVTTIRNETYMHTTTKVIRQTGVLRKTRSYADGIYHTDEQLAFDPYTGSPVWTKSYDEFSQSQTVAASNGTPATTQLKGGAYAKQSIMAAWKYPGMAHKYLSEGKVITGSIGYVVDNTTKEEALVFGGGNVAAACPILQNFAPGDLLQIPMVIKDEVYQLYYYAGDPDFLTGALPIYPSNFNRGLFANATQSPITKLTIVHSGRSNELTIPAGSTTYHNPDGVFTIPNPIDDTKLSGINAFTADLNTEYNKLKTGTNRTTITGRPIRGGTLVSGKFALNVREYSNLNISAYANKIPEGYKVALDNATIRNVQFRYNRVNGNITLKLISFEVFATKKATNAQDWVTIAN